MRWRNRFSGALTAGVFLAEIPPAHPGRTDLTGAPWRRGVLPARPGGARVLGDRSGSEFEQRRLPHPGPQGSAGPLGHAGGLGDKNPNTQQHLGDTQLAHCIGVARSLISENPPSVNSPQFQNPQGTLTVTDNVTVFPSATNAAAETPSDEPQVPLLHDHAGVGTAQGKAVRQAPQGHDGRHPAVLPVDTSAFGPGIVGFSMSVPITSQGVTINFNVTQLFVVKGRLGHQVSSPRWAARSP